MATTIKTLRDGRSLASTGHALQLDGEWVGGAAAVQKLAAPKGNMTHYLRTAAGTIGLTAAEAAMVARLHREAETEASRSRAEVAARKAETERKAQAYDNLYNEGGEGYNPIRTADPYATDSREPETKQD